MQLMAYVVMPDGSHWKVKCNGVDYPHYATQDEAMGAAVQAAYDAGNLGYDALVLIQDGDGRDLVEWSYGREPRNLISASKRQMAG